MTTESDPFDEVRRLLNACYSLEQLRHDRELMSLLNGLGYALLSPEGNGNGCWILKDCTNEDKVQLDCIGTLKLFFE